LGHEVLLAAPLLRDHHRDEVPPPVGREEVDLPHAGPEGHTGGGAGLVAVDAQARLEQLRLVGEGRAQAARAPPGRGGRPAPPRPFSLPIPRTGFPRPAVARRSISPTPVPKATPAAAPDSSR